MRNNEATKQNKAVIPAQAGISQITLRPPFSRGIQSIFVVLICLILSSCGFRPLYQNTDTLSGGVSSLNDIWIDSIPNQSGLELRNGLIDRFYHAGVPEHPRYHLHIDLIESYRNLALSKDSVTTRSQLVVTAEYRLMETATGEAIEKGSIRAASSYNILSSQYTTVVTLDQARHQILAELADKMTMRMAVVMDQK